MIEVDWVVNHRRGRVGKAIGRCGWGSMQGDLSRSCVMNSCWSATASKHECTARIQNYEQGGAGEVGSSPTKKPRPEPPAPALLFLEPGQSPHWAATPAWPTRAWLGLAWPGSRPGAGPGTTLLITISVSVHLTDNNHHRKPECKQDYQNLSYQYHVILTASSAPSPMSSTHRATTPFLFPALLRYQLVLCLPPYLPVSDTEYTWCEVAHFPVPPEFALICLLWSLACVLQHSRGNTIHLSRQWRKDLGRLLSHQTWTQSATKACSPTLATVTMYAALHCFVFMSLRHFPVHSQAETIITF